MIKVVQGCVVQIITKTFLSGSSPSGATDLNKVFIATCVEVDIEVMQPTNKFLLHKFLGHNRFCDNFKNVGTSDFSCVFFLNPIYVYNICIRLKELLLKKRLVLFLNK